MDTGGRIIINTSSVNNDDYIAFIMHIIISALRLSDIRHLF